VALDSRHLLSALAAFSTVAGSTLAGYGIGFFGVDAEFFDGFVDYRPFDLAVDQQLIERAQRDEPRIDSEEIAQRGAPIAAAKTIHLLTMLGNTFR